MTTNFEDMPLPYGWSKEFDASSGHYFYVDTKATPPRSIWVHPYQDPQYLSEHPEVREKVAPDTKAEAVYDYGQEKEAPPPAYSKDDTDTVPDSKRDVPLEPSPSMQTAPVDAKGKKKQSFFDKVFGKDEDEERKQAKKQAKREAEIAKEEQKRQAAIAKQSRRREEEEHDRLKYGQYAHYHNFPGASHYNAGPSHIPPPPPPGMYYAPPPNVPPNMHYPPPGPPPGFYGPGQPYPPGQYGAPMHHPNVVRNGSGSGSMALPVLGGLAGGLLLGSLLDF